MFKPWLNIFADSIALSKGSFTNYVDKILACWHFLPYKSWQKHFWSTYPPPPPLVNVVCERSLKPCTAQGVIRIKITTSNLLCICLNLFKKWWIRCKYVDFFCLSLAKISGLNFCTYPTFFCVKLARVFFPGRRFSKLESPLWQYVVDTVWDLYHSFCNKKNLYYVCATSMCLGIKPNFA